MLTAAQQDAVKELARELLAKYGIVLLPSDIPIVLEFDSEDDLNDWVRGKLADGVSHRDQLADLLTSICGEEASTELVKAYILACRRVRQNRATTSAQVRRRGFKDALIALGVSDDLLTAVAKEVYEKLD